MRTRARWRTRAATREAGGDRDVARTAEAFEDEAVESVYRSVSASTLEACEWPAVLRQLARFVCTSMARERLLSIGRPGSDGGRADTLLDILRPGQSALESNNLLEQTQMIRDRVYLSEEKETARGIRELEKRLERLGDVSVWLRMINTEEGEGSADSRPKAGAATKRTALTVLDVRETDACVTCIEEACECIRASQDLLLQKRRKGDREDGDGDGEALDPVFGTLFSAEEERPLALAEDLVRECRRAVKPGLLYLDARASPELERIRSQTKELEKNLRESLEALSQDLFDAGVVSEKQVVFRRDRYCVPLRRGTQGMHPSLKGAITLGRFPITSRTKRIREARPIRPLELTLSLPLFPPFFYLSSGESKTGQTVYVEPKFCVALNNDLAKVRAEEAKEEKRILKKISGKIRKGAQDVYRVYRQVEEVDFVLAKAKHALWTGGRRPEFLSMEPSADLAPSFDLKGVVHPVLLENALDAAAAEPKEGEGPLRGVVPVNIRIPGGCRVLTISGPNTGGKTATIKTIALCLHMAKCGIFIRTQEGEEPPRMIYHQALLADVGDNQNLEASLSTFSSHVTRLRDIVRVVEGMPFEGSLVLLDEVGSGTNPNEGSAIAVSLLKLLSQKASLTVATTHFSELKQLAARENQGDSGSLGGRGGGEWLNASVGFDMATLRPTYQLLEGESGASNAMHIARAIGLGESILRDAEEELEGMMSFTPEAAAAAAVAGDEGAEGMSTVWESLVKQERRARDLAERSRREMASLGEDLLLLDPEGSFGDAWRRDMEDAVAEEEEAFLESCLTSMSQAIDHYESGRWDQTRTDAVLRLIETKVRQRGTELAVAAQDRQGLEGGADGGAEGGGGALWFPKKGERVRMKKLGGTRATVVSLNPKANTVTLKKGSVTLTASIQDIEK